MSRVLRGQSLERESDGDYDDLLVTFEVNQEGARVEATFRRVITSISLFHPSIRDRGTEVETYVKKKKKSNVSYLMP